MKVRDTIKGKGAYSHYEPDGPYRSNFVGTYRQITIVIKCTSTYLDDDLVFLILLSN